jgi:hypothetical protein
MRRISQARRGRTNDLEEDATFADPTARCAASRPFDTVLDMHDQVLRSGATGQIDTRRVSPCYWLETTGAHILHYSVHVKDERMGIVPRTYRRRITVRSAHRLGRRLLAKYQRESSMSGFAPT